MLSLGCPKPTTHLTIELFQWTQIDRCGLVQLWRGGRDQMAQQSVGTGGSDYRLESLAPSSGVWQRP